MFDIIEITENKIEKVTYNFPDYRLQKRYTKLEGMLEQGQSSIMNKLSKSRGERKGGYDFFKNKRVEESVLKARIYERLLGLEQSIQGEHVLVVGDTTEYNFLPNESHLRDKTGLGTLSNESSLGYLCHVNLAFRAADLSVLGLSDLQLWHREEDRPGASTRKQRDFEQKESYKWHVGLHNSHQRLSKASKVTYIQDRDGDIYESIVKVRQLPRAELLVRSCRDRKIQLPDGRQTMLYAYLDKQQMKFSYELKVRGDKRINRSSRIAKMEVYSCKVKLKRPANLKQDKAPSVVEVDVVWVRESSSTVPHTESPIDWKLITTHQVLDTEQLTRQLIQWYENRWFIEEFFLSQSQEHTTLSMLYWKQGMAYVS